MLVPLGEHRRNANLGVSYSNAAEIKSCGAGFRGRRSVVPDKENKYPMTRTPLTTSSTPGVGKRMLKDDLIELLSTARLSELQAELKSITPAPSSSSCKSAKDTLERKKTEGGASSQNRPIVARGSDVHPPMSARAVVSNKIGLGTAGNVEISPHRVATPQLRRVDLFQNSSRSNEDGSPAPCLNDDRAHEHRGTSESALAAMHSCAGQHYGASIGDKGMEQQEPQTVADKSELKQPDVSPTTMMQIEINKKREALFSNLRKGGFKIGRKGRTGITKRRNSNVKTYEGGAGAGYGGSSRPNSRRQSQINENHRRKELDQGESAGALKFRELRNKLDGHNPTPKTVACAPSPSPLFKALQDFQALSVYSPAETITQHKEQGVIISMAPKSRTPPIACTPPFGNSVMSVADFMPTASMESPFSETDSPALIAGISFSMRRNDGKKSEATTCKSVSPANVPTPQVMSLTAAAKSPLSESICAFQIAQDKQTLRCILVLWRNYSRTSKRQPSNNKPSLVVALQHELIVALTKFTLLGALRHWMTVCSCRRRHLQVRQKFISRCEHRLAFAFFHSWAHVTHSTFVC
jgi:hypothetical protein